MVEINRIITPDLGETAPQTNTNIAGSGELAAAAAAKASGAAVLSATLSELNVINRNAKAQDSILNTAQGLVKDLDEKLIQTRNRSKGQDVLVDSTLRIDQRLQALFAEPGVEPLELAAQADAIVKEESDKAFQAGRGLGRDVQTYLKEKMNNVRLNKIPAARREGFKRESQQQIAALNKRNFNRKAEMYADGTTADRQVELAEDIVLDIMSYSGTHFSADRAQALAESETFDLIKNNILGKALVNPDLALAEAKALEIDPDKKSALINQIQNMVSVNDNARRKQAAANEKAEKKFKAAMHSRAIDRVHNGEDAGRILDEPGLRDTLTAGQKQGLMRYSNSLVDRETARFEKGTPPDTMTVLRARYANGASPVDTSEQLLKDAFSHNMNAGQQKELYTLSTSRYFELEQEGNTELGKAADKAEGDIKRNLSFEKGFLALLETGRQTQLNVATSGALQLFREKVTQLRQDAVDLGRNPNAIQNVSVIANEVMIDTIPQVITALKTQSVKVEEFANLTTRKTPAELAVLVSDGTITFDQVRVLQSIEALASELDTRLQQSGSGSAREQAVRDAQARIDAKNQVTR